MSLARFIDKWTTSNYPPEQVSATDLDEAGRKLGFPFPADYKREVLEVGLPRPTIDLLEAIVERNLGIASVGAFYSPQEIISETTGWRELGMPQHLVTFASDESGNKFCFSGLQVDGDKQGVWLFDHDFGTVEEIAPCFSAWTEALCDVEPVGEV